MSREQEFQRQRWHMLERAHRDGVISLEDKEWQQRKCHAEFQRLANLT